MDKEYPRGIVPTGRLFVEIESEYGQVGRLGWFNGDPSGEMLGFPFFGRTFWSQFGWTISGYSRQPDEADAE